MTQVQINDKRGVSFPSAVRAFLRHDPDILLIGEIRDQLTAQEALRAAMTGHQVFTTLHTNKAIDVFFRLHDLGIPFTSMADHLSMIISQRLIRKLCPECKKPIKPTDELINKIKTVLSPIKSRFNLPELNTSLKIYGAGECANCNFSGYRDRIGVFEIFVVSKNIERLILTSPPMSAVEDMAISEGMITLIQDAYIKLIDGITSIEEIERVI